MSVEFLAISEAIEELRADVAAGRREIAQLRLIMLARAEGTVAGRVDLDSGGDLVVAFEPKSWKPDWGAFKGKKMSQASPDFLDHLARAFQSMGDKDRAANAIYKGKPSAPYQYRKAALCRGWALRLRLGWTPPPPPPEKAAGFSAGAPADAPAPTGGEPAQPSGFASGAAPTPAQPPASSRSAGFASGAQVGPSARDNDAAEPEPEAPAALDAGDGEPSAGEPPPASSDAPDDDELPL